MQQQLFAELEKARPNYARIRALLTSGQADINATTPGRHEILTAFWYIQAGLSAHQKLIPGHGPYLYRLDNPMLRPDSSQFENEYAFFKAYFYPLLDILEDFNFDIMNGSSFRVGPDGTRSHHMFAGFRLLDLIPFNLIARVDPGRLIQFFERLYFSRGLNVDDTSVTGIPYLNPLLFSGRDSYQPMMILYFIIKGANINLIRDDGTPRYPPRIFQAFATNVTPDAAAKMIVMIQKQLGANIITKPAGSNLRTFLVRAYGSALGVEIIKMVPEIAARDRRSAALLSTIVAEQNQVNIPVRAGAGGPPNSKGGRRKTRRRRLRLKNYDK